MVKALNPVMFVLGIRLDPHDKQVQKACSCKLSERLDVHGCAQARRGAQAHDRARGQARWSSTDVRTCMCMHAGDVQGVQAQHADVVTRLEARGRARSRKRTGVTERLDARLVMGALFTQEHGHHPKKMKST
ncbi:hypothetical protein CRG98_043725 [Punica granatum]|uniref:Uncharacterized protein n=1 Tax=Punica granatum TaxID=22663 RepID=A0A2I0HW12_PUNGR|nr:hypothetical protein CRG98_043725 [Punica granatum]